ncbi:MAG TPA: biotin/lipoyl-containing protein, partial [Planctomycetaceae bacterium]|nr:biotin/lipoyl-containing protein [Planctomycetaceae bacterium]
MAIEFKLPAVGENVDTAEIGTVRVAEGDTISPNQVVMDIETDKAVFELPSPHGGKITKVHVKQGDSVQSGAVLLTIEESDGAETKKTEAKATEPPAQPAEKAKTEKPAKQEAPPKKGQPAESPNEAAPAAQSKEATSAPAPSTDRPRGTKAPKAPAAVKAEPSQTSAEGAAETAKTDGEDATPAPAGPATRRLARELGVDLHDVQGTGSGGRITTENVHAYVRDRLTAMESSPPTVTAAGVPP